MQSYLPLSEVHSEPSQTCKMEPQAANQFHKSSIFYLTGLGSEYASASFIFNFSVFFSFFFQ